MSHTHTLNQIESLAPKLFEIAMTDHPIQSGLTSALQDCVKLLKIMKDGKIYSTKQLASAADLSIDTTNNFLARLRKGGVPFSPYHCGGKPSTHTSGNWQLQRFN